MSGSDKGVATHTEPTSVLTVGDDDAGKRIDAYLASRVKGWSRARLQRLIEAEDVLVNGGVVKAAYKLRSRDEIELDLTPSPKSEFTPEDIPLEIVYEDEALVVVNKPAGLVVHPGAGIASGTLANALAFHFQELSRKGGQFRPGIVHRLDRDTSGLLVVAKTEAVHENLAEQFQARTILKSYVALVHGSIQQDAGRIDQPIARDPRNRIRMMVSKNGRSALSLYHVRKRYGRFTLLEIELKTGRTHQIRVHLSWVKHPVVGDEIYGGGRDKTLQDPMVRAGVRKLGRQFLHAEQLGFIHPTSGQPVRFSAPLPNELSILLKLLDDHYKETSS